MSQKTLNTRDIKIIKTFKNKKSYKLDLSRVKLTENLFLSSSFQRVGKPFLVFSSREGRHFRACCILFQLFKNQKNLIKLLDK